VLRGISAFCAAVVIASSLTAAFPRPAVAAPAADCPPGGAVRFGVEPSEAVARLTPAYNALTKEISEKLGCPVELYITTSYNAEIEAMRNGKLDVAQFGPLGYILAHQVAGADAIATFDDAHGKPSTYTASIVTWPGSGITTIKGVAGHSFAYADPASTSGHLFPAYGLRKAGIDPDHGVKGIFAGSHTASFEAILNHKVDAGELNSIQIDAAKSQDMWQPAQWVTLWQSSPIPVDPITVRRDLPAPFKRRVTALLQSFSFADLSPDVLKVFPTKGTRRFVPTSDAAYDQVRDLVKTLNIDLTKLS
jgi:phosphonate transport system substrate-binding protein